MEYNKLRGRIIEKFGTIDKFADFLDKSRVTVSNKLNGKSKFTRDDIIFWSSALKISQDEIGSYFFEESVYNV